MYLSLMLNPKTLVRIFIGKKPVENIATEYYSLKDGIINYSVPFVIVSIILSFEIFVARFFLGFFAAEPIFDLIVSLMLLVVGLVIAIPFLLIVKIVFLYIFGSILFLVAGFYRKERGSLNDFMGNFLSVFASVTMVVGLLLVIPLVGWILAIVAIAYSIILTYRFIREKFNLTDSESAIVVLIPTNLILAIALVIATAVSFFLIGSRIF